LPPEVFFALLQAAADALAGSNEPKPRNYRQTVCTYWLRGLCMKGDTCGFLHQFDPERMPVCRSLLKYGVCKEPGG
jgi:cleavage and polyadenylation specificity factor subunit 4